MNFWRTLPHPFFVLAPMADVTDLAFRRVIARYGKPDVMWTEFVSADGLVHAPKTIQKKEDSIAPYDKLLRDLVYTDSERPIVAQFFTAHPEAMRQAAFLARELGFDGIDINMGCPDKSIERQGAGAAMIKNPANARAVIRAAKEAGLPVSVKTRIGFHKNELHTWIPELLAEEPVALTLHCRTRKEMSKVPARWEHVAEVVRMRNELNVPTLIIGNGDVVNIADARRKVAETGCDGVMLGRAIFGNPWLFSEQVPDITTRLNVMIEHTYLFQRYLGDVKNFALMKKHYKAYCNGFDGAKELRIELMETQTAEEVEEIVHRFLKAGKNI